MKNRYQTELDQLREQSQLRSLKVIDPSMVNLSSNDYLGIGTDEALQDEFLMGFSDMTRRSLFRLGSTSSRLLTGNHSGYSELEEDLALLYNREAGLVFNSGYHANVGILPALSTKKDLILSDKLNHASIVDGARLCEAKVMRYRHNDYEHLETLLKKYAADADQVFIITESIFSMDGDLADLSKLVELKNRYNAMLLVDEAHGVGVLGKSGCGLCEATGLIDQIDIIIGTFGKAFASMGAFAICDQVIKDYLINKMRPLIFSTSLPPMTINWNRFVLDKQRQMNDRREHLKLLGENCRMALLGTNFEVIGQSQIIPIICGENSKATALATKAQEAGFVVYPIRPPTVPKGSARLRLSLTANLDWNEIAPLFEKV